MSRSKSVVAAEVLASDEPPPSDAYQRPTNLRADEETGALRNERAEMMVLMMADGIASNDAWKVLGGRNQSGYSAGDRERIVRAPIFKRRLKALMDEKAERETEGPVGQVRWMAMQLWRTARASNDMKGMQGAMTVYAGTLDKSAEMPRATQAGGEERRGPGRPPVEAPTKRSPGLIRQKLLDTGAKMDSSGAPAS